MNWLKKFIKSIDGISTPIGGISWVNKSEEKKILYDLFLFLSGQRILKYDHGIINKKAAISSLSSIRKQITKTLTALETDTPYINDLLSFREIIQNLQSEIENLDEDDKGNLKLDREDMSFLYSLRARLNSFLAPIIDSDSSFARLTSSSLEKDIINL